MKRRWKVATLMILVLALSGAVLVSMGLIRDAYLEHSYEEYEKPSITRNTEPVTLHFAWWGGSARHKVTLAALTAYEKKNPGITIVPQYQEYDNYHDKITVQLSSSSAPDLFQLNPENLGALVERKNLVPLDNFVQEGLLDISNIPESNLFDGKYKGQLYGIPMSIQTFCILYNKYLFDIAGLPYPEDNWSWKDYENTLWALKSRLPSTVYPSADLRCAEIGLLFMIHQQGGAYLTKAGQPNFAQQIRMPLAIFQAYAQQGLIPPTEQLGGTSVDAQFVSERVAMAASYNAMAQTLQAQSLNGHKYGLAAIPSSATGSKLGAYVKGDLLFVINRNSTHQKEAVKLLNAFLNDPELIEILGMSRGIPPSTVAQQQLETGGGLEAEIFRLQRLAEQSNDVPEPRYISGWSECVRTVDEITLQYAFQKITLNEAVELMERQFEKILLESST